MSEAVLESPLVVVCASAGGLEALSGLLSTLPTPFPAPILIAQHQDPGYPSHLAELLTRHTPLSVVPIVDQVHVEPGTIFVVPAAGQLQLTDQDISVVPNGTVPPHPSIDRLLAKAAATYGKHLIAVILTGSGSDGAAGARAVREAGGVVVIQNPATAAYPAMPAAVAPDTVDFVADLPQIGPLLYDLLTGATVPARPEPERASGPSLFMPDPELHTLLRAEVLPELIAAGHAPDRQLRFWVTACATGEEAYGLAIALCELLGPELDTLTVKIIATDRDDSAVAVARKGVFPAAALAGLPADTVARYFTPDPGGYAIEKRVRRLMIFGQHDLARQAPFPHIDLVLCPDGRAGCAPECAERALDLFAYALREGGYLVLGRTAAIQPPPDFFVPFPPSHQIYRRQSTQKPALFPSPPTHPRGAPHPTAGRRTRTGQRERLAAQQVVSRVQASWNNLLHYLPIGVIVIDTHYAIQDLNEAACRLLSISNVEIGGDLLQFAPAQAQHTLRAAINRTIRSGEISYLDEVEAPQASTAEATYLRITCCPQPAARNRPAQPGVLILLTDITSAVAARQEVARAREDIAWLADARRQAAANAELETINLELQATIGELYTSKHEELQATNAELETINQELRATIADLYGSNRELAARGEELQRLTEAKEALQRRLLQGVIQAQENERQRVARELHDDIGQTLTGLVLTLGAVRAAGAEAALAEQQLIAEALRLAEEMMSGLRRVIADLRPAVLDDLGLLPALRRLASDLKERTGIAVRVQADDDDRRLPPTVELTLFRVAQEALANIGKHAHAQHAGIVLRFAPGRAILSIHDDGQGLPPGSMSNGRATLPAEGHFGLLGMQERVALLNGVFAIKSTRQGGTTIRVELPLDLP